MRHRHQTSSDRDAADVVALAHPAAVDRPNSIPTMPSTGTVVTALDESHRLVDAEFGPAGGEAVGVGGGDRHPGDRVDGSGRTSGRHRLPVGATPAPAARRGGSSIDTIAPPTSAGCR
jgi:multidrug efflux pump subunit AcrA (membrane-fusion protein)